MFFVQVYEAKDKKQKGAPDDRCAHCLRVRLLLDGEPENDQAVWVPTLQSSLTEGLSKHLALPIEEVTVGLDNGGPKQKVSPRLRQGKAKLDTTGVVRVRGLGVIEGGPLIHDHVVWLS